MRRLVLDLLLLVQVAAFVTASAPDIGKAVEGGNKLLDSLSHCMNINSPNSYTWGSIVDFLAYHSSWYEQYITGKCNSLPLVSQAVCWGNALDKLIDPTPGDLVVLKGCVCDYFQEETGEIVCPKQRKKRSTPGRRRTLDSADCPSVNRGLFTNSLVSEATSLKANDRTLLDFQSVIQFVSEQEKCVGTCECGHAYHNAFNPAKRLKCRNCWPTRLVALTKPDSDLYNVIANLVVEFESRATPETTNVTCSGNSVHLDVGSMDLHTIQFLETDDLVVWNKSVMSVSEVDPQCRLTASNTLIFPIGECRPSITVINQFTVEYEYTIMKVLNFVGDEVFTRSLPGSIIATCTYTKNITIDFSGRIVPTIRTNHINKTAMGNFSVSLSFYSADFTTSMAPGFEVTIPNWLYTRATLLFDQPGALQLLLVDCWATPTSNSSDKHRYDIITDYCPIDEMYKGGPAVEIIQSGRSEDADFRFRSFVFAHDFESIAFVHCLVEVCSSNIPDSCANCTTRAKRSLDMEKQELPTKLMTVGPVRIREEPKKTPCDDNNGGCPELCEIFKENVRCSCFPGRQLSKDRTTCVDPDDSPKSTFGQNLIVFLMGANVAMLFVAFVINRRKWE